MKVIASIFAFLLLSTALAQATVPTCQSLGQQSLKSRPGSGWGKARCGGDDPIRFYAYDPFELKIRPVDGVEKCLVLPGDYTWSCRASH